MERSVLSKIGRIIIIVAAVVALIVIFVAGYKFGQKMAPEKEVYVPVETEKVILPEKRVVSVEEVEAKIDEMAEFTTYSSTYTVALSEETAKYFKNDKKVPFTTNKIDITASGIVKVGYDLDDIGIEIDEDTIYISIPEAKLNDNYVIWDTVQCIEDNNIFNQIEFSQYYDMLDEIKEKGLVEAESKGIYDKAEKNLKKIMKGFLSEFNDYKVEFR